MFGFKAVLDSELERDFHCGGNVLEGYRVYYIFFLQFYLFTWRWQVSQDCCGDETEFEIAQYELELDIHKENNL